MPLQLVKKALLQGVPPSADDGIKYNLVISGDMCLGNDTSHEVFADNFARNRGKNFVRLSSKKWLVNFNQLTSQLFRQSQAACHEKGCDMPLFPSEQGNVIYRKATTWYIMKK